MGCPPLPLPLRGSSLRATKRFVRQLQVLGRCPPRAVLLRPLRRVRVLHVAAPRKQRHGRRPPARSRRSRSLLCAHVGDVVRLLLEISHRSTQ